MTASLFSVAGFAALSGGVLAWPRGWRASCKEAAWWLAAVLVAGNPVLADHAGWSAWPGLAWLVFFRREACLRACIAAAALGAGALFTACSGFVTTGLALSAAGIVFLGAVSPPPRLALLRWLIQCGARHEDALAFLSRRERRGAFMALTVLAPLALLVLAGGELPLSRQVHVIAALFLLRWLSQPRSATAAAEGSPASSFRPVPPAAVHGGPLSFDERPPDGSEQLFSE